MLSFFQVFERFLFLFGTIILLGRLILTRYPFYFKSFLLLIKYVDKGDDIEDDR